MSLFLNIVDARILECAYEKKGEAARAGQDFDQEAAERELRNRFDFKWFGRYIDGEFR